MVGSPDISLTVRTEHPAPDVVVLRVTGEVDMSTGPEFQLGIQQALDRRPTTLIIDLAGVTFFGTIGLSALLRTRESLSGQDARLWVVGPSPVVTRAMELSGVARLVDVADSVDALL